MKMAGQSRANPINPPSFPPRILGATKGRNEMIGVVASLGNRFDFV